MKKRYAQYPGIILIILLIPLTGSGQVEINPAIGIAPDPGFPIWLTPDTSDYLPLAADQTSGLDWVATDLDDYGNPRHWFVMVDDARDGGLHLISLNVSDDNPEVHFHGANLSLPPPYLSMFPVDPAHGYDLEGISIHPWSGTVFIAQEGYMDETGIYNGKISVGDINSGDDAYGRGGDIESLPGYLPGPVRLDLPGWNEIFMDLFSDNIGIEGIACTEDRLFLGLESPYSFPERLVSERSTILAIWRIDPENPADMGNCELLAVHDTSDWAPVMGYTIETICGLDAVDNTHLVGVDRDNQRLFSIEFTESGEFADGKYFYLDTPGPAPLADDECPELEGLPRLFKPSLESVAVVPSVRPEFVNELTTYYIYLVVDPWGPGWTLVEQDWDCPSYEKRLTSLLPAIYRYSLTSEMLFP